ncbi:unnamed protein product [Ceratitis capitata]|uniref:(Mediterranean fruit fly) hypothetical protein n=1 Tax=Ceratitis capitata TaxID=7213 RepID=A0A811U6M4_CERCA|nr:unnamed protein product [Ceratitis capitata]
MHGRLVGSGDISISRRKQQQATAIKLAQEKRKCFIEQISTLQCRRIPPSVLILQSEGDNFAPNAEKLRGMRMRAAAGSIVFAPPTCQANLCLRDTAVRFMRNQTNMKMIIIIINII